MSWNDHVDFVLSDRIEALVDDGCFDPGSAALGIARQVMHGGTSTLSDKQRRVYEGEVEPLLRKEPGSK